jgi:hypothetical protein
MVMVFSWFFMIPNANIIVGAWVRQGAAGDYTDATAEALEAQERLEDAPRQFVDGKICLAFYCATAMAWYGVQTGLFRASDEDNDR